MSSGPVPPEEWRSGLRFASQFDRDDDVVLFGRVAQVDLFFGGEILEFIDLEFRQVSAGVGIIGRPAFDLELAVEPHGGQFRRRDINLAIGGLTGLTRADWRTPSIIPCRSKEALVQTAFSDVKPWPKQADNKPAAAAEAVIGHNRPPMDVEARADFDEKLAVSKANREKIAQLVASADRAVAVDEDSLGKCGELVKQIRAADGVVSSTHETVKAPYLAAGRAVDAAKNELVTQLAAAKKLVEGKQNTFLREEQARAEGGGVMEEHPIQQPIREVDVYLSDEGSTFYRVGKDGVTRIEACQKSGLHANIPYVRVWAGDNCLAEFCQHNIVGVYFADPAKQSEVA